jgi:hypothetical protein
MGYANVRGIDVAIDVVIGDVAMFFFTDVIGEPAYCEQVGGAIESNPVVERKALAGENSVGDGPETLVG